MQLGKTLYVTNAKDWRSWLSKHHDSTKEIWLVYYKKSSGKPRIPYDDAVEQALCFGWIDSTAKKVDDESFAQRFTPRREGSAVSELNKERIRRLFKEGKMTLEGLLHFHPEKKEPKNKILADILKALKKDKKVWEQFQSFPQHYKTIRIAFIEGARNRPEMFQQRLNYFLKMTKQGKKFGTMR